MKRVTEKERKLIRKEKRRIWNVNHKQWSASDPNFDMKYELCYSYIYRGVPGGWYLYKKKR